MPTIGLCAVCPHPTASVLDWLKGFAEERRLRLAQDAKGNTVIYKPGQAGGESAPTVILQVGEHPCVCACVRAWYAVELATHPLLRPNHGLGFDPTTITYVSVVRQGHVDMVCEKNSSSPHDFECDPIQLVLDSGWLKAKDTTLGADNGIGEYEARSGREGHISCTWVLCSEGKAAHPHARVH